MSDFTSTISYYNRTAENFVAITRDICFDTIQKQFLSYLPPNSHILDFGCGSGRDSKYFLEQGYQVTAIDGSLELCKLAREYLGIPVKHMLFQELDAVEEYDGIWACASILHLPYLELIDILLKMKQALKEKGIIYTSFKYGSYEGERDGRYFTDMTEERFSSLLNKIKGLKILKQWVTKDVRAERSREIWLNLILQYII